MLQNTNTSLTQFTSFVNYLLLSKLPLFYVSMYICKFTKEVNLDELHDPVRKLNQFESMTWFYKYPKSQIFSFFHFPHTSSLSRLFSIIMTTKEYLHIGFESIMYMYFLDFEL